VGLINGEELMTDLDAKRKEASDIAKRVSSGKKLKKKAAVQFHMLGNQYSKGNPGPPRDKLTIPEIYTLERLEQEAELLIKWFEVPRNIWLKNFALQQGYEPQRLDEFANKSADFALALKKAHELQQGKLVEKGLFNEINANLTKFVLQNCHGWKERTEVSGDAANPISFLLDSTSNKSKELTTYKENDAD
jgi:hypothetical protein